MNMRHACDVREMSLVKSEHHLLVTHSVSRASLVWCDVSHLMGILLARMLSHTQRSNTHTACACEVCERSHSSVNRPAHTHRRRRRSCCWQRRSSHSCCCHCLQPCLMQVAVAAGLAATAGPRWCSHCCCCLVGVCSRLQEDLLRG